MEIYKKGVDKHLLFVYKEWSQERIIL